MGIIGPTLRMIVDVAEILKMDARHILFASLRETGKEGGLPRAYIGIMNSLENKSTDKEEKDGTKE